MRKLYTNAIFLLVAAMTAAAAFAAVGGANPAFAQASLIFGTTLAGGALSVGMVFASRKSQASFQIAPWLTPIDLNVAAAVLVALSILGSLVSSLPVEVFVDAAAEGIVGGVAGSIAGILMAFAKKDEEPDDAEGTA